MINIKEKFWQSAWKLFHKELQQKCGLDTDFIRTLTSFVSRRVIYFSLSPLLKWKIGNCNVEETIEFEFKLSKQEILIKLNQCIQNYFSQKEGKRQQSKNATSLIHLIELFEQRMPEAKTFK